MPYQNYPVAAELLENDEWMTVPAFIDWLNEMETINISVQEGRNKGLEIFNSRKTITNFFSDDKRFPNKVDGNRFAAVCLNENDWPSIFEQLLAALNYKPPDISRTDKNLDGQTLNYTATYKGAGKDKDIALDDETSKKITSQDERRRLENTVKSFTTAIQKVRSQLGKNQYTMRKFETTFSITWST